MNKAILILLFLFIVPLVFLMKLYFGFKGENEPFRCVAQFKQKSFVGDSLGRTVNSNAIINLILTDQEHGFFSIMGSVKVEGGHYNLRRVVFFSLSPSVQKEIKVATIVREEVGVTDKTPEDFWYNGITPEKPGIDFHIEIKKINKNTMLIDSLSIPLLICIKQGE